MATTSILSNPYNQVGQMHNDGMQFVIGNINPSSTIEQIVQSCASYVQKLSDNSSSEAYVNWNAFISESINRTEKLQLSGMIDWLQQKDLITKEGIDFINSINDLSDDLSLSEVVSKIDSIENDILSSKMSVEQQSYPLLYAAVAKYSAQYGELQETSSNSKWKEIKTARKFSWPWKKDAEGAISGAIGGAIGGIGGGLAGVGIGALLGAIGGGLGSSIAAIFIK
ncbi:hypothetical protein C1637_16265 [Chryseobacterium lactis]|uniref:Uncharacterized protein n=3 Tax=Bacteroidota TaxID=976 RepID=A0A4U9VKK8_9SPHI|nr:MULTISPECIES: hypothetical protein [Bacteroidota]MCT3745553.1 hypothetical protein [Elizabethkingia anophelis]AZA84044.1 hypothetical protein EG342_20105 [Chryseobacterium lactis]AZB04430.1 hypothetical protein EG341_10980 [Chryseobacterium lactis]PNW12599.1 hypothetical protein C1637_16265 [Chryseobacterium lactis]VTR46082.1 Uncharacterised protein [Sphingobacterium thalpophilum]